MKTNISIILTTIILFPCLLALFGAKSTQAIPPDYEIDILPFGSHLYAINDFGQAVGQELENYEAILWNNDGTVTKLGYLNEGAITKRSCALDINNLGEVVGYSSYNYEYEPLFHAFLWTSGIETYNTNPTTNLMRDLGTLGGLNSCANKINDLGQIVGWSGNKGFLYDNFTMIDIGTLGGEYANARSINNNGQIVGESQLTVNGYNYAFSLSNNEMINLGAYDEYGSSAADINNNEQIVGSVTYKIPYAGIVKQAILWENGEMINLGYLEYPESFATSINDLGQIVGVSRVICGPSSHFNACLWDSDGKIYNLNDFFPQGYRTHALDINNNGQIVGYAEISVDDYRGFIMTPIPEPLSIGLLGTGLIGLILRKGKK